MYLRNIFLLNLFVSLIMSQEQLGSDIDGEAAGDYSSWSVSLDSDGDLPEMAILYLIFCVLMLVAGPGKYSADSLYLKKFTS